jgi:hypothetical protein
MQQQSADSQRDPPSWARRSVRLIDAPHYKRLALLVT